MYGKSLELVQFSIKIIQLTLNITDLYQFYQNENEKKNQGSHILNKNQNI